MSIKLRDLIRAVRACKTAAEERAVITKECALIRTAIKEEDEIFRQRNVAKLMYIHMLGYPTHFGQMECLKLVSANSFPEKRIGYLGLTLLLTEQTEVLTLVTNTLKVDLSNNNQYIQALSLVVIGNLATQDMARDLISDVEKILKSNNAYLKKKAALATIRLLKKEPDLIEHITERIAPLLKDRSHGVLITALQLVSDIFEVCPEQKEAFSKIVPTLVRLLRNFVSMGFSPEHDVSGITDPFMQVKLLGVLRQLGNGNADASDQMTEVLAQVATNTESAKNVGNSILYECVKTILGVESDANLKTLAINILGRFLLNRDNNIRYVALQSLTKVVAEDNAAVQRHRNTIVECLKDPDVSIRQRALELVYQLVNPQNVEVLTAELLNYLCVCNADHKAGLVSHIMTIVEKFSPTVKWRLNTIITMLNVAGKECNENVISTCILFISQAESHHPQLIHHVFRNLQEDTSQTGYLQVGVWCIGEYASMLVSPCARPGNDADVVFSSMPAGGFTGVSEVDIINALSKFFKLYNADVTTKAIVLNALMKLTVFASPNGRSLIQGYLEPFRHSMNLELQQRSNEYSMLLSKPDWTGLRTELLAKMPVVDEAAWRRKKEAMSGLLSPSSNAGKGAFEEDLLGDVSSPSASAGAGKSVSMPKAAPASSQAAADNLLDIFGGPPAVSTSSGALPKSSSSSIFDDLSGLSLNSGPATSSGASSSTPGSAAVMDIFGGNDVSAAAAPPAAPAAAPNNAIMDLFGGGGGAAPASPAPALNSNSNNLMGLSPMTGSASPGMSSAGGGDVVVNAMDKAGFGITLHCSKPEPSNPALTKIVAKFSNSTPQPFSSLVFQAAVPKYMKLELLPPTSTSIPSGSKGGVSQEMRVTNTMQGEKNIVLKLKLSYNAAGKTVDELVSVSAFPSLY